MAEKAVVNPAENAETPEARTEKKAAPKSVKVLFTTDIRADYGAFDGGRIYELDSARAEKLIKEGYAKKAE